MNIDVALILALKVVGFMFLSIIGLILVFVLVQVIVLTIKALLK